MIRQLLNVSLDYHVNAWVREQAGREDLGYGAMVPSGIRQDLSDGPLGLPVEVKIGLAIRRSPKKLTV